MVSKRYIQVLFQKKFLGIFVTTLWRSKVVYIDLLVPTSSVALAKL